MKIQIFICLALVAIITARRHGKHKRNHNKCRYERGEWGSCDLTTNTASMTLTVKEGSSTDCVPTQTKSIPCEHLEQIKAWKAKKEERRNKMGEHKEEKNRWKKHKKALKEKYGLGCKYDVTVTECNKETNLVTKHYKVTSGDAAACHSESISYSCDLHEKLMRWKEKRQMKRKNKNHKRKQWKKNHKESMKNHDRKRKIRIMNN